MDDFLGDIFFGGTDQEVQGSLSRFLSTQKAQDLFSELGQDFLGESGEQDDEDWSEEFEDFLEGDYGHERGPAKPRIRRANLPIHVQREMYLKERSKQVDELNQKLPKGVKIIVNENNVPLRKRSTAITEEMKSYTVDPNEPILKFSEMFIAPEEPRIFPKTKKGFRMKLDPTHHVEADMDEQELHDSEETRTGILITPKTRQQELSRIQPIQVITDGLDIRPQNAQETQIQIPQAMEIEEENHAAESQTPLPTVKGDWTSGIIWESKAVSSPEPISDEESDDGFPVIPDYLPAPQTPASFSSSYRPPTSFPMMNNPMMPPPMYTPPMHTPPMTPPMHLSSHLLPPPMMPSSYLPSSPFTPKYPGMAPQYPPTMSPMSPPLSPSPVLGSRPGVSPMQSAQPVSPMNRFMPGRVAKQTPMKSRFIHKNAALLDGSWTNNIVWNDADPEEMKAKSSVPLLLDMNDSFMTFDKEESSESSSEDSEEIQVRQETRQKSKRRALKLPGRILTGSDLLIKERQAAIRDLDPFNLSSDRWYIPKASLQTENTTIQHSLPGEKYMATKQPPSKNELRNFHRPRKVFPQKVALPIVAERRRVKKGTAMDIIRHQKDLSAKDGRVILMEYMEEYPPILADFGMGAKIRNYYRRWDLSDNHTVAYTDGESISLQPDSSVDPSPFIADIPNGQAVQSFENNLYKVPIFHHQPHPTDFLLVRGTKTDKSGQGSNKYYIREIPALYTAGQILPLKEVPAPNSRIANQFMVDRLQAFVYWMFKKRTGLKGMDSALRIRDVQMNYPGQSEGSIRKRLKHCAEFRRGGDDSGSWILKSGFQLPTDEEARKMTPPDEVVLYECMLAGHQKLQDMGITGIHNVIQPNTLATMDEDAPTRRACKIIEEELLLTPWHLSSNFVQALEGKCLLQLSGFGDPSGRGEAFSFLRLPMKVNAPGKGGKEKEKEDLSFLNSRNFVTGTSADLRKLSLDGAHQLLLDLGIPEDEIPRGRWERIAMVRKMSSEAKAGGEDNHSLVKFARGSRFNVQHLQEQIDTKLQTIFNNQIRALSATEVASSDDELDDGDDSFLEDIEKDMESEILAEERRGKKRPRPNEDEEEEKRALDFLKEVNIYGDRSTTGETSRMIGPGDESKPAGLTKKEHTPAPGQKYYLKRTRTVMREDGAVVQIIDIITSPEECKQVLEKKKRQEASMKRFAHHLSEEDEQKKISMKKEKRRLQEKMRRQKKILKNQKFLQERYKQGSKDGTLPGGNVTLKCGRCGMFGHMKTNKSCPVYAGEEEEEEEEKKEKTKGPPLSISIPTKLKKEKKDKDFL